MVPSERECSIPTCIIAGAGPGLGLAVAERYAREGFSVYTLPQRPALLAAGIARLRMRCDVFIYNTIVEGGHVFDVESASAAVDVIVKAMQVNGGGAVLFSTYECPAASLLREFVHGLAEETEPFGIRVGIVTIDGALPAARTKLALMADVYWELFFSADLLYESEVRVRTDLLGECE
jgi:hypothetical protein